MLSTVLNSERAIQAVRELRRDVVPRAFAGVNTQVYVGGATAEELDYHDTVDSWLPRVLLFVPKVLVALLILAFGAYFARFVGNSVSAYFRNVHLQDADLFANIARYAILAFVVLIALDQVNIGGDIVRETFLILLAGVVFALALAFGLGGREWAAEFLERWWPHKKRP